MERGGRETHDDSDSSSSTAYLREKPASFSNSATASLAATSRSLESFLRPEILMSFSMIVYSACTNRSLVSWSRSKGERLWGRPYLENETLQEFLILCRVAGCLADLGARVVKDLLKQLLALLQQLQTGLVVLVGDCAGVRDIRKSGSRGSVQATTEEGALKHNRDLAPRTSSSQSQPASSSAPSWHQCWCSPAAQSWPANANHKCQSAHPNSLVIQPSSQANGPSR